MAIEIVRDYFKKFDMDNKILEFPVQGSRLYFYTDSLFL